MRIPVSIQKRHIHLSKIDAEKLFGKGYIFGLSKEFTQLGEFFTKETLSISGPKGTINNIDIILPFRKFTQVEIYQSDNDVLGINAQTTRSGELQNAEPIIIIGPKGNIYLEHSVIIAEKHIHMSIADAKKFELKHNQIVTVYTPGINGIKIENVRIKANDKFDLDFHLNYELGEQFGLENNDRVSLNL